MKKFNFFSNLFALFILPLFYENFEYNHMFFAFEKKMVEILLKLIFTKQHFCKIDITLFPKNFIFLSLKRKNVQNT